VQVQQIYLHHILRISQIVGHPAIRAAEEVLLLVQAGLHLVLQERGVLVVHPGHVVPLKGLSGHPDRLLRLAEAYEQLALLQRFRLLQNNYP